MDFKGCLTGQQFRSWQVSDTEYWAIGYRKQICVDGVGNTVEKLRILKQRGAKRIASKCINGIHRRTFRQLPHKVVYNRRDSTPTVHSILMPKRPTLTSQFRVSDTAQQ